MNGNTCGYYGSTHVCGRGLAVGFISRGFDQNDYCVGGKRVRVSDSGETRYGTDADLRAIMLYELDKYADYLRWRAAQVWPGDYQPEMQPFTCELAWTVNASLPVAEVA